MTVINGTPAFQRHAERNRRRPPHLVRPLSACAPRSTARSLTVHQLSFEGPDRYSSAGGLGVRVTGLANALAATGVATDLYFVGDPDLPAIELRNRVTLRRWCQHISRRARAGVYDAEEDKIADLCTWWPAHLADRVHADAAAGIHTIVLAEDWHTVWPLIGLHHELERRGLRSAATLAWTANNRFGFDRIDFGQLAHAATILTISRAMKHLMWNSGVNPLVVPNGIPDDVFTPIDAGTQQVWADTFADRTTLAKVGRWDPDKRWHMAIGTVATLRNRGERAILLARGWDGNAAAATHYAELRQHAAAIGLEWTTCDGTVRSGDELAHALSASLPPHSGIVELTQSIAGATLQSFYAGTSAVLANSGFEPFGLVGLEAMAAGALVITGATGEDYVESYVNGFALDTDAPQEIVRAIDWTRRQPLRAESIRSAAIATADRYRWPQMVERIWLALDLPALVR